MDESLNGASIEGEIYPNEGATPDDSLDKENESIKGDVAPASGAHSELAEVKAALATTRAQLADANEKLRIRTHKAARAIRNAEVVFVSPVDDDYFQSLVDVEDFRGAVGLAAKILAHAGGTNLLLYIDPGPHPRGAKEDPGWSNAPAMNIERILERIALSFPEVVLSRPYVRAAAAAAEALLDRRMNTAHARVHRAINHAAWLALIHEFGLEKATAMKEHVEWWLLRRDADAPIEPESSAPSTHDLVTDNHEEGEET